MIILKKTGTTAATIILIFLIFLNLWAEQDIIILNNIKTFQKKQRSVVRFPHGLHMAGEYSCKTCHHLGTEGTRCAVCHKKKNKGKGRYTLQQAFHLQCMGCHSKLKKSGKKTGPRLCAGCHPVR
ncbi:MAG: cytochrome c3 family protein [bacterium]|nr:cytochrome c3 family protein [bacterium]